ncbi:MAG: NAD(P)-dependent alcohol dehydrogenase [Nitrospirota bacterium]|nr:NAD(P)-dependent alcohol dehydrogenase [Nitrospirota bacterium]
MKAVVYHHYGPPEVLGLEEKPPPVPGENEVLVHVRASSVNAGDWHMMRGEPFLVRLMGYGLLKPKHTTLGFDLAGQVAAVGGAVTRFQPGDAVFGLTPDRTLGAFAEYACAPEHTLVPKPAHVSFEEAAAVPAAAITALQGLRDAGRMQAGHQVLINGAGGGVGTFAVQIAKALGAKVTAVTTTGKLAMARSLGADRVIDYTGHDFTRLEKRYDLIFDVGAYRSISDYLRVLNPAGRYVLIGGATGRFFQAALAGPLLSMVSGKKITTMVAKPNQDDLMLIRELLAAGTIRPVIDLRFPLSDVAGAIRQLEGGHVSGKLVITV